MALFNITINVLDDEDSKKKLDDISKKLDQLISGGGGATENPCIKNEILKNLDVAIQKINNIV
jgi:hypothetical protein